MSRAENGSVRARRRVQYVLDRTREPGGGQYRRRGDSHRAATTGRGRRRRRQLARDRHWARSAGARAEPARGALQPDVAINATPLGLKETDPLPLDAERAGRLAAALDLVYAPGGTRWARTLRAAGVPAQDGREVLVQQGAAAFGRFFPDRAAPVEVMRAAVDRALRA